MHGDHTVSSAADAAKALAPFAGRYAEVLFAVGLLGASLLAAAILPVTAAYVIAETFGFEKGIRHRPREAPVFVGVITVLIAIGTIVALHPGHAGDRAARRRAGRQRRPAPDHAVLRLAARREPRS